MPESQEPYSPARQPRPVPPSRALDWYSDALRLWKRGPVMFALLSFIVLLISLASDFVPYVGVALAQIFVPLAGCALQYASLASDRGDRPRLMHAIAVFSAPPRAMVAVILADAVPFAAEVITARLSSGVDLIQPGAAAGDELTIGARLAVYTVGLLTSLPLTFVPFAALFDFADLRTAFRESIEAFLRNPGAMLAYGAMTLVLLVLAFATSGIGLLLVLPWFAAASYAAWKDIFAVAAPTAAR